MRDHQAIADRFDLTGDYVLDPAHTRIGFVARHRMATRVHGQFEAFEGRLRLDAEDAARSIAQVTINADSIETHNRQRDDALRNYFLDSPNHPAITFTTTKVTRTGDTTFQATGDLTIRGTTHPVTLDLTLTGTADTRLTLEGTATINRTHWHANWNTATTLMVSPKVTLTLTITAVRQNS